MVINMFNNEFLNNFFEIKQEKIEENIQEEYHKRIGEINVQDEEEKNNIKMNIISELYYKQGFKDGAEFIINIMKK